MQPSPGPPVDNGDAQPPPTANSIAFDTGPILTVVAGDTASVGVFVDPPGEHVVRFALLGDSIDASIDRDSVTTDSSGRAAVVLTASRSATTFRLRAKINDGPTAEIGVSVGDDGFASVIVTAAYSGTRETPAWTATAVARTSCADLQGIPPPDGPIVANSLGGETVRLDGIPVGPRIAITMRSAYAVGGCANITGLVANEQRAVTVNVLDAPLTLGDARLFLEVQADATDGTWLAPVHLEWLALFIEELFPADTTEAAALLDAMQLAAPAPNDFAKARVYADWDALVTAYLAELELPLRDQLTLWATQGLEPPLKASAFSGTLQAVSGSSNAMFTLTSLAGLDPTAAGSPIDNVVSVSADTGDVLHLGGKLFWPPTSLINEAITSGATHDHPAIVGGAEALAAYLSCSDLATMLANTEPLPECDDSCISSVCSAALTTAWQRARNVSLAKHDVATLSFSISGQARVDAHAVLSSFEGAWVGTVASGDDSVSLKGSATASRAAP